MKKNLYYIRTLGYDMVVSYCKNMIRDEIVETVRIMTENNYFPIEVHNDEIEIGKEVAKKFLEDIEDDSSWEIDDEWNYKTVEELVNDPDNDVLAEIEKIL